MIVINFSDNEISIKGHAHYAEIGRDIVCAGVSALVQTLIQSIEELTADKILYDMKPGTVHIQFEDLSEGARLLVKSFFVGVEMIASEYPDNVTVQALNT